MTIHFVPGDPNPAPGCLDQVVWRKHHIVTYSSGANLIIYTVSEDQAENIQTVTLEKDAGAVAINYTNGLLCVAIDTQIAVFGLVDEYTSVLRWTEKFRLDVDKTKVNCLQWATEEDELVVGTEYSLSLFHIVSEFGEITSNRRWQKHQPSTTESVAITSDGSKVASYSSSNFDNFAKVWLRISYGDESTLFDLVYADHDPNVYITTLQWRKKKSRNQNASDKDQLESALHIRNMPTTMSKFASDSNDILYTITSDNRFHVWATCDFNGHIFLKHWYSGDLVGLSPPDYMTTLLVEHSYLDELLVNSEHPDILEKHSEDNYDILMVVGKKESCLYSLHNVASNPPSSISVQKLCTISTNVQCIPHYRAKILSCDDSTPLSDYVKLKNPIANHSLLLLPSKKHLSFLMHDRVKNNIRCIKIGLTRTAQIDFSLKLLLLEKFQGHAKPIKKLITSSSSHENNIMLSILEFSEHNYIWEPLILDSTKSSMSITKRFRLNVTRNDNKPQGVADAIIINDIAPLRNTLRHHLIVVVEKGGFLSVWDCDGVTMDDNDVKLIQRLEIKDANECRRDIDPATLLLQKFDDKNFVVVAIYGAADHNAWRLRVDASNSTCQPIASMPFPGQFSDDIKVSTVDTFLEKDVSVIDNDGRFSLISGLYDLHNDTMTWARISSFHTSIRCASFIRGASLINKVAIVHDSGRCLAIWDTKFSHLEFEETFPENYGPVTDIDWTFIGSKYLATDALLSVGFRDFVLLYTQLRYDYTNKVPTFAMLKKIDISQYSTLSVADLIWLDDSNLVIGSGNQFFVDDKFLELGDNIHGVVTTGAIDSTIRQLLPSTNTANAVYQVSDLVTILNGPIPVYHPQFLIQALLLNEVDAAEAILVRLLKFLRGSDDIPWDLKINFPLLMAETQKTPSERRRYSIISNKASSGSMFEAFDSHTADLLIEKLATMSLPLLTRHQQGTLRNLVIILNKLQSSRSSLDENGYKFLLCFELFQLLKKQKSLSMRDVSWALHSDQKEVLYSAVMNVYKRLDWQSVKNCGLVYWLDVRRLRELIENVAKCEFADERDASGRVSVLYLAIKKKQLLIGLWKTTSHPEKEKVLKFLNNNFSEPRWQSAAMKNAFVLLGKHRYLDAAYFFLLADKIKDCCLTLCNKLGEVELALAVAKVNENKDTLILIIERYVLPQALAKGDRWYTSWVFWELDLAGISIQALVKSPRKVVKQNSAQFLESFQQDLERTELDAQSRSFLRDDPVLAVLYEKLRGTQIDYYKGSKAVLPEEEFDFVVRVAAIYARMGCDYLALMVLRNWRFAAHETSTKTDTTPIAKDLFLDFNMNQSLKAPQMMPMPTPFVEPDMSSFSFGF